MPFGAPPPRPLRGADGPGYLARAVGPFFGAAAPVGVVTDAPCDNAVVRLTSPAAFKTRLIAIEEAPGRDRNRLRPDSPG